MIFHRPKRREVEVEKVTRFQEYFTCSTCGKVFQDAVKVRDLATSLEETYYACPRCLAKANIQDILPKSSTSAAPTAPRAPSSHKPLNECLHYENLKKRLIPDECLVCPKLIECSKRVD